LPPAGAAAALLSEDSAAARASSRRRTLTLVAVAAMVVVAVATAFLVLDRHRKPVSPAAYLTAVQRLSARDWTSYQSTVNDWSWPPTKTGLAVDQSYFRLAKEEQAEAKNMNPPSSFADAHRKLLAALAINVTDWSAGLPYVEAANQSGYWTATGPYVARVFSANAAFCDAITAAADKAGLQVPAIILTDFPTSSQTAGASQQPASSSSSLAGSSWSGQSLMYGENYDFVSDSSVHVYRSSGSSSGNVQFVATWSQQGNQVTIDAPDGSTIVCDLDGNAMTVRYQGETWTMTRNQ
jgi:hypothetical protein